MDIILHIGAHKTASTHLQIGLNRAHRALSDQGIAVFTPRHLRGETGDLARALVEGDAEQAARLRAAFSSPAVRLLISEENILGTSHDPELMLTGRFYPRAGVLLPRLAALLPQGRVRVALAVREPASFVVSAWSQRLLSGVPTPFDEFLCGLDPALLRWSDLVWRVRLALPDAQVSVWRYEDWPVIAPQVLEMLLGAGAGDVRLDDQPAHPGLSAPAVAAVMAEGDALSAMPRAQAAERVRALRDAWPKTAGHAPHVPLTGDVLVRSRAAYDADVQRIAAMPDVHLLAQG